MTDRIAKVMRLQRWFFFRCFFLFFGEVRFVRRDIGTICFALINCRQIMFQNIDAGLITVPR